MRGSSLVKRRRTTDSAMRARVEALIASKRRFALDVPRARVTFTATQKSCLTSNDAVNTAASGTGILTMDGDSCFLHSVRIKGVLDNRIQFHSTIVSNTDHVVRKIVVWFNKPLLVPDSSGTLPPITEVLVSDSLQALPINDAANGGRFVILSDRIWTLGQNWYSTNVAEVFVGLQGKTYLPYDYTVPINRTVHFATPSQSDAGSQGGTYDSNVSAGRVSTGLLILYTLEASGGDETVIGDQWSSRLDYTG